MQVSPFFYDEGKARQDKMFIFNFNALFYIYCKSCKSGDLRTILVAKEKSWLHWRPYWLQFRTLPCNMYCLVKSWFIMMSRHYSLTWMINCWPWMSQEEFAHSQLLINFVTEFGPNLKWFSACRGNKILTKLKIVSKLLLKLINNSSIYKPTRIRQFGQVRVVWNPDETLDRGLSTIVWWNIKL